MKALAVSKLTKTYANGVSALKGIDLTVEQGDFFALLGQNGAGKSTTIGIICSLVLKTSGQISVFGHDLDANRAAAKSLIGVVPQEMNFSLFDKVGDILINAAGYYGIPREIAKVRAQQYLEEMGIAHMYNNPAIQMSGGMKRRLMIARSLMNEPQLLILDEPTAGVDVELRHTLWAFLKRRNEEGTTIILTTHYLEEAEHLCKNVAIIDHGQIIEAAPMKSLVGRLHLQTVILDFDAPLATLPALENYTSRRNDESSLEIEIPLGQSINPLFAQLSQLGLKVTSMRNKTNRLEELFINLVNKNKGKA